MNLPSLSRLVGLFFAAVAAVAPGSAWSADLPARTLRVAGVQMPVTTNIAANVKTILRAIEFAARERAQVLVTPEGSLSGYTAKFNPTVAAEAIETVAKGARAAGLALVLGTCFADSDGQRYDAQRFYSATGEYLGFHAKILLCRKIGGPPRPGEMDYFRTSPLRTFALGDLTVGGLVCNDMGANPEWTPMPDPHLAHQLAGMGARVIFLSVNSGIGEGDDLALNRDYHDSNLRLRARSAGVWVVVANAADPAGRLDATCPSGIVSAEGRWVLRANPKGEQFFVGEVTP